MTGADDLRRAFLDVCAAVISKRDELGRLDAEAGDGDLGVTLSAGFSAVQQRLEAETNLDVGQLLELIGRELGQRAPSTMGTLLGSSFRRAGKLMVDKREIEAADLAEILEAVSANVQRVGDAREGQRSVVDAMEPSARAARAAADAGEDVRPTARAAAAAAWTGVTATVSMKPELGRAAWLGARAEGHADAGATAWAMILDGLADGLRRGGPAS